MKRQERLNRVSELSSRLFDLGLSLEERGELNGLLRGDPESCERYLEMVEIHAYFVQEQSGDSLAKGAAEIFPFPVVSVPAGRAKSPRLTKWWPALAGAAAVTLLIHGSLFWKSHLDAGRDREPSNAPGVAVLSRLVDGVWANPTQVLEEGASVPAGRFQLESGLAQLEFFSGATLIVEGPGVPGRSPTRPADSPRRGLAYPGSAGRDGPRQGSRRDRAGPRRSPGSAGPTSR